MKKLIFIILSLYISINFVGCGSDNTQSNTDSISITTCSTPTQIETYTPIQNGDEVIPDSQDSSVERYFGANDTQLLCLASGQAHIERAY